MFLSILLTAIAACASGPEQSQIKGSPTPGATQGTSVKLPEGEWGQTVAAAKKEGKIVIIGPPGEDVRHFLVGDFIRDFPGIEVDWSGIPGAAVVPKVKAERRAGLFTVDFHIGGTTSIITGF